MGEDEYDCSGKNKHGARLRLAEFCQDDQRQGKSQNARNKIVQPLLRQNAKRKDGKSRRPRCGSAQDGTEPGDACGQRNSHDQLCPREGKCWRQSGMHQSARDHGKGRCSDIGHPHRGARPQKIERRIIALGQLAQGNDVLNGRRVHLRFHDRADTCPEIDKTIIAEARYPHHLHRQQ